MPFDRRRGFTLVEVCAAMSLAGFALLGGVMLLDQIGDSADRIAHESARAGREMNGARLLARLLLDATPTADSTRRFRGDEHGVELWTSCVVPGGWMEPCRASVAIDSRVDSSVLIGRLSTGESYPLRALLGRAELRYFDPSPSRDTSWVKQWSSSVSLPVAVGIVVGNDTIVYPVSVPRD